MGTSIDKLMHVFILSYNMFGDGYDTHIVHPTSQGLHKHLAFLRAVELVHVLCYRVCHTPLFFL